MRKPDFCICENKDAGQLRGKLPSLLGSFFILAGKEDNYKISDEFEIRPN